MRKAIPRKNKLIKFPESLFNKIEAYRHKDENKQDNGKPETFCSSVYILIRKGLAYDKLEKEGTVPPYKEIYCMEPDELEEDEDSEEDE